MYEGRGDENKSYDLAERLDHKHTSKDFSCQEVMHFFLGRIQQHRVCRYTSTSDMMEQIHLDGIEQIQVIK